MRLHSFEAVENLWIFLSIAAGIETAITQGPLNTVAEIGKQVKLDCTADMAIGYWVLSKNGDTNGQLTIVGLGCSNLNPAFAVHYAVESLGGGTTCNLIIFNITMEQAGVYKCIELSNSLSILTVIETPAKATTNITTNVTEGEFVGLQCSMKYNGSVAPASTLLPIMYWTDINGQNVSSSYDSSNPNEAVLTATFEVGRQDKLQFACHVYFQLNVNASNFAGYAANTPTNNYSANTSPIDSYYSPSVPEIMATSSGFAACEAKNLTCYSDANPPPNYNWVDLTSGNVTNEQKIIAECGVNYICNASNIFRNVVYVNSSMFYETSITNTTCKLPRATNMHISGDFCKEDYCECECNSATIQCFVDAYPAPSYEWLIPDGSSVQDKSVEANINGIFVCRSYTLIDGWYLVEAYKSINITGCSYSPITTTYSTENILQCSSSETAAIVLGVLLAISVTAHIISLVVFYRKGAINRRDSSEPEAAQPTSNPEEPHYQDLFKENLAKGPEYEELHH